MRNISQYPQGFEPITISDELRAGLVDERVKVIVWHVKLSVCVTATRCRLMQQLIEWRNWVSKRPLFYDRLPYLDPVTKPEFEYFYFDVYGYYRKGIPQILGVQFNGGFHPELTGTFIQMPKLYSLELCDIVAASGQDHHEHIEPNHNVYQLLVSRT